MPQRLTSRTLVRPAALTVGAVGYYPLQQRHDRGYVCPRCANAVDIAACEARLTNAEWGSDKTAGYSPVFERSTG
jgi:hypothetical protein